MVLTSSDAAPPCPGNLCHNSHSLCFTGGGREGRYILRDASLRLSRRYLCPEQLAYGDRSPKIGFSLFFIDKQ